MEYTNFDKLTPRDVGQTFNGRGKVTVVKQTSGPTLMMIDDGTKVFTFKAFVKPGIRAFPEIDVGDMATVTAVLSKRMDNIEGEVKSMTKMSEEQAKSFEEEIEAANQAKYLPKCTEFSIKSEVLESLKPRFIQVATMIRQAVMERRPIILRHDADCDGYSSAMCMQRAIIALMDDVSGGDRLLPYQNFKRAPSKAPFYEYEDAMKDMAYWLRDKVKNGAKAPLVIITDNGSTEEDILGYRQVKLYDCPIAVIDHHYPGEKDAEGKVAVDHLIQGHINPYLEGHDSNVCSGMLGYELARFIYENNSNEVMIPAMAGLLDHVDGPEKDAYIKLAEDAGYTQEYMTKLGTITYLQSHYLRFQEAREFVDDLFGNDKKVQNELVEMLYPEIEKRFAETCAIGKHYSKVTDMGKFHLVEFEGEKGTSRGQFPAVGLATNQIHAMFEKQLDKPVITMTYGPTFLTIRVGDDIKGFSVPTFCTEWIQKKIPHTGADGGGHEHAGSVKFVEYAKDEVLNLFKEYLTEINSKQ